MSGIDTIKDFINIRCVRITPSKVIFEENNLKTVYKRKITLQNVGKFKVGIKIYQPNSNVFQIDSIPNGIDLSPGLKIIKTVKAKKNVSKTREKECLIPIFINDYRYDYLVVLSPTVHRVSVTPNNLDFGLVNIGTLQVSQTLTIINSSEKDFPFQVDLRDCNDNVIVEPARGKIKAKKSYPINVRVVTLTNLDIECIIFIKCAFQYLPVQIKAKVIVPIMEIIHPNATQRFTCLIFPHTYYGLKCSINLFIRNYSAVGHMFGTFGEFKNKYIELEEARNSCMDFKFFKMKPSDGIFQSNETRLFTFSFCPIEIDRYTKNKPYFFCKFLMHRFLCNHYYFKQNAESRSKIERSASNITFCKSLEQSRSDPFIRESMSVYIFCKEKSRQYLLVDQTENSYTRFYLYGSAETPSVRITPDSLNIENIPLNLQEIRVIELKNNSKTLPIIFRYKKTPFIFLESEFFHLNSLESIQISVRIEPKRLGRITTRIEFDLMYYDNNNELKIIGETNIEVDYNVSSINNINNNNKTSNSQVMLKLNRNDVKKKNKSVTLTNLMQTDNDRYLNDYYSAYMRKKLMIKSQSMITLGDKEEYDVTNSEKILCKDLKLSKSSKLVMNEKIKRNMFFLPLTPQEMANIVVIPPVIRTPQIATYNNFNFKVLIKNFNSIPIRLLVSTDTEKNIIFQDGKRFLINKNEEITISLSYKSGYIGYYVSALYFIVNDSTVLTIPLLAEVVPAVLKVSTTDIQLDSKNISKYIDIENPLNIDLPFMWVFVGNIIIEPSEGIVSAGRTIVCMVTYCFDEKDTDLITGHLYTGSLLVESVYVRIIENRSKITVRELNFGKIPLNEEVMDMVVLRNNCDVNRLKFYVDENDVPQGLNVFPLNGVINPLGEFYVFVTAKFTNCVIFKYILKINTNTDDVLEIPIQGEVIYPDITITPTNINVEKIPTSTTKFFNLSITNNSQVPVHLTFDLNEYQEFFVSQSTSLLSKEIITTLKLNGQSTKKIYIHFQPHGASSWQFYLPIILNNILGPPILNDLLSTKVQYYLTDHYDDTNVLSWMPEFLPCIKIHTLVTPAKIEISKTFLKFSTIPTKKDQSKSIFISNPNRIRTEVVCIKYNQLNHPLYIEDDKHDKECLIFALKPNEKISFTVSFKPNPYEFGDYKSFVPIYLRSDTTSNVHNLITIEATYHKPDIKVSLFQTKHLLIDLDEKFLFNFYPVCLLVKNRNLKSKVVCTNHLEDCKLSVRITTCSNSELEPIKWEFLEYSRKIENYDAYSIELMTYDRNATIPHQYARWYEIYCSCGGCWLQKQERIVENSVLTAYIEIDQLFTHSLGNCNPSYPLYPESTDPTHNFMEQICAAAECWLNTQVIFFTNTYQIKNTISFPNYEPPSQDELKRCTKLSGIPMLHIIGNLIGSDVFNSLIKKYDLDITNNTATTNKRIKCLFNIYKTAIKLIKNEGGSLMHLRPEHLFNFADFKKYYEDIFDFHENPLPLSSTMLNYDVFLRLNKQSWLDFVLQVYKCFYLKRIIEKHSKNIKNLENTPLPDYFSNENVPIQPTLYSESESFILNWLQFHYNKNRNDIWDDVTLNEISVDLYNNSLCDGLVFGVVLLTYCPYLKHSLKDLYFTPERYSQKYHNLARIIQCLEMLNYSFKTKPEEILEGNSIRLLMFSVYLFDILPNMYPVNVITLKTGLSTNISNKIELENENPFPVAYKVILINNDSRCFNVKINFFEIKPKHKTILTINYFAKYAKIVDSTLILSGECPNYRYVSNKCLTLIGIPDVTRPFTTINIQQETLTSKHYEYLIKSPYKVKTKYRLQLSYETLKEPDDLLRIIYQENRDFFASGRMIPEITEFESNENGEINFPFILTTLSFITLDIWLYFRNEEIGDFVIKIVNTVKDTLQREKIFVKIPKYVLNKKVIIEIPNKDYLFLKTLTAVCVGLESDEGRFWSRIIESPEGPNIISSLYSMENPSSHLPTLISTKGTLYKVTQKSDDDVIMPDKIYFEDECTDLTTKVTILLQNSTPRNFSFVLESIPLVKKRYYTVFFRLE